MKYIKIIIAFTLFFILSTAVCSRMGNDPPTLMPIKDMLVYEGDWVRVRPKALDSDGDGLFFWFSEPLDSNGYWHTKEGDAGVYRLEVTVSDGRARDSKKFDLVVIAFSENIPALEYIPDVHVREGDFIKIVPHAWNHDYDPLEFTFTAPLNARGEWQTTLKDAGTYTVTVTVDDGQGNQDSQDVMIVVREATTGPPTLHHIEDMVVERGEVVTINPRAEDPDGDPIHFTYTLPLDSSGRWDTIRARFGKHVVAVTAHSRGDVDSQDVEIFVKENRLYFEWKEDIYCTAPVHGVLENLTGNPTTDRHYHLTDLTDRMVFVSSRHHRAGEVYFFDFIPLIWPPIPVRLTENAFYEETPVLSPSGEMIVFSSLGDICIMDADGNNLWDLTIGTCRGEYKPRWHPIEEWIYYISGGDLWVMESPRGTNKRNLSRGTIKVERYSVSPDGKYITYVGIVGAARNLCIMSSAGKNKRDLILNVPYGRAPAWSPDGRKIAFIWGSQWDPEIYVMNIDKTGLRNLSKHRGMDSSPAWSPDGKKVAFYSARDGGGIYTVDATGTNLHRVMGGTRIVAIQWK